MKFERLTQAECEERLAAAENRLRKAGYNPTVMLEDTCSCCVTTVYGMWSDGTSDLWEDYMRYRFLAGEEADREEV